MPYAQLQVLTTTRAERAGSLKQDTWSKFSCSYNFIFSLFLFFFFFPFFPSVYYLFLCFSFPSFFCSFFLVAVFQVSGSRGIQLSKHLIFSVLSSSCSLLEFPRVLSTWVVLSYVQCSSIGEWQRNISDICRDTRRRPNSFLLPIVLGTTWALLGCLRQDLLHSGSGACVHVCLHRYTPFVLLLSLQVILHVADRPTVYEPLFEVASILREVRESRVSRPRPAICRLCLFFIGCT